ncbi:MAG: helix-turn-helix domain-containing protein, partial [Rhodococcus sp.]
SVARLAESALREKHRIGLDQLRMISASTLARASQPTVVVDRSGWVAAVDSMALIYRIALPKVMSSGEHWLPSLGLCMCEPLPGGWLVRPQMDPASGTVCAEVELDVQDPNAMELRYSSAMGSWSIDLSPRHSQILVALTQAPEGLTASQLASQLFGDPRKTVTVRAEMSRLRKRLAGILLAQPYRFDPAVRVKTAPAVRLY